MAEHQALRVYVSSPCGFTDSGQYWYYQKLVPQLRAFGFSVLDPWTTPHGQPTEEALAASDEDLTASIDATVGVAQHNERLLRDADAVLAVLDGADVDSGVAAEIGFASALAKPIVGLRTDRRFSGDTPGSTINLQVLYYVLGGAGGWGAFVDSIEMATQKLHDILTQPAFDASREHGLSSD